MTHKRKRLENTNLEHILALMMYCNFTELQCHFSKTYRTDNGQKQAQFYHLGKLLKLTVHTFGLCCLGRGFESFCHGIGEKLSFPMILTGQNASDRWPIFMECPLSTSSSVNFTNNNNGLIVEFVGEDMNSFSVSWLSGYANESEYLFLQMSHDSPGEGLKITNIYEPGTGMEYKCILRALQIIELDFDHYVPHNDIADREQFKPFIVAIISHQLSKHVMGCRPFKSLSLYAQKICGKNYQSL